MLISWERQQFNIDGSASVGIGTTTPSAKLEVNGYIKLTSGSGTSITFADGTVQTTAWTGSLCSDGGYAESVDVTGNRTHYEPGDVLVVDPDHPGYRQTFGKDFSPWRETHVEACGPDGESLGVVFETASPFETLGWMKDLVDWFQSKLPAIFLELQLDQLGIPHCRQLIGSPEILHPLLVGSTRVEDGQ